MAVTTQQILRELDAFAPPELAEDWDNCGLLVDANRPVTAVLTTLDITPAVVAEAAAAGCELIVAHHPVIFRPLHSVSAQDVPALLLQNGISAICMHTNLDAAPGGVNDTLAALFGMAPEQTAPFAGGCGRIGRVEGTTVRALAEHCQALLGAHVRYTCGGKTVTTLAEVSGSGGSFWGEALRLGADCLLTGEASHHDALDAAQRGLALIVAGHWNTERPIAAVLAARLGAAFPQLRVAVSQADAEPWSYL